MWNIGSKNLVVLFILSFVLKTIDKKVRLHSLESNVRFSLNSKNIEKHRIVKPNRNASD